MRAAHADFHLEIAGPPVEAITELENRIGGGVADPFNAVCIDLPKIVDRPDCVDGEAGSPRINLHLAHSSVTRPVVVPQEFA
jgi:hypothetical protein